MCIFSTKNFDDNFITHACGLIPVFLLLVISAKTVLDVISSKFAV